MSRSRASLLVVDDEALNRELLGRQLRGLGYTVTLAGDGRQALDLLAGERFQLVLLDIMMPGIDGLEVLKQIRAVHTPTELPVIMVSGIHGSDDVVEALRHGANDYVTKPLDLPVALARVQTHLALRAMSEELASANLRMKRDLEAAAQVQRSLLPDGFLETERTRIAWVYRPCEELAGDALNFFPLDDRHIGMYVLDVSGHGVQAALLSVALSRFLSPRLDRSSLVSHPGDEVKEGAVVSPAEVARRLNRTFPMDPEVSQFFTFVYGVLDTASGQFRYVCAGHPGPIHARPDGSVFRCRVSALPIGIADDAVYQEATLQLQPGDRLFLHSDGLVDETNAAEEAFDIERVHAAVAEGRSRPLAQSVDFLVDQVVRWHGDARLSDDLSILAIEVP